MRKLGTNGRPATIRGIFALVVLIATPLFAEVEVEVRTLKSEYLIGEPVFVIVEVKNTGREPVGYSYCDGRVTLSVRHGASRKVPRLDGCFTGRFGGGGCAVDHPPILTPGASTTFEYLLRGYELDSGDYELRVFGKAGVRRTYYPVDHEELPVSPPSPHPEGDAVQGQDFDAALKLTLRPATEAELRQAFAPFVSAAHSRDVERRLRAREAIAEMAPAFLEDTIAAFAGDPDAPGSAIDALARINTPESRRALVKLFNKSNDPLRRSWIVENLARTGHSDNLQFFKHLLRSAGGDDRMQEFAALGLGRLGGNSGAIALRAAASRITSRHVRCSIAIALGNTRSKLAVPMLIRLYGDPDLRDFTCGALITLTHRRWCDGSGDTPGLQAQWSRWWIEHGSAIRLFGPDECPDQPESLPVVP
ncbi:MAG: hypothetical protein EHM23_00555 [Acidobacteria bacterium]|nr:MAG: hypothetical protein EHM23_00555 [Acidobacteriota bacterium]